MASNIWKLGCNWGSGKPSFYEYIKQKNIVIGVEDKKYKIGDLIVVAEGHQVKAIARVKENPKSVTSNITLQSDFENLEIEYDTWVNYANADFYELNSNEKFTYQLQQGICKVNNFEIRKKVLDISSVNFRKLNYKEQYTIWLNSTNKEGSKKVGSYIRAIEIISEITKKEIFEEDNVATLTTLYQDLLSEQEKTDGKYYYAQAPSYGVSRFYSASTKSYSEFIKQLSQPQSEVENTQPNMTLNQILFGPPGTGNVNYMIM